MTAKLGASTIFGRARCSHSMELADVPVAGRVAATGTSWDTLIPSPPRLSCAAGLCPAERRTRSQPRSAGLARACRFSLLRGFDGLHQFRRGGLGVHLAVELGGDHVIGR